MTVFIFQPPEKINVYKAGAGRSALQDPIPHTLSLSAKVLKYTEEHIHPALPFRKFR